MPGLINVKIPDTIIGLGAINNIGDIAKSFAPRKILILTDAGIVKAGVIDAVKAPLKKAGLDFEVFDGCQEEPPIPLVGEISEKAREGNYDLLIGIGGGSVMDTTKVVSATAFSGMTIDDYISTGSFILFNHGFYPLQYPGMHHLIEAGSGIRVTENNLAQLSAVNGPIEADNSLAEGTNHRSPGFSAGLEDLMPNFIGVNHYRSQFGQELCHCAFTAAIAAGEADYFHVSTIYLKSRLVYCPPAD